jgi:hypothetical protein
LIWCHYRRATCLRQQPDRHSQIDFAVRERL